MSPEPGIERLALQSRCFDTRVLVYDFPGTSW